MDISNFIAWFIQQFINIGTNMLGILDRIIIAGNLSLMDFIITVVIVGAFIGLIITTPTYNALGREINKKNTKDAKRTKKEESK